MDEVKLRTLWIRFWCGFTCKHCYKKWKLRVFGNKYKALGLGYDWWNVRSVLLRPLTIIYTRGRRWHAWYNTSNFQLMMNNSLDFMTTQTVQILKTLFSKNTFTSFRCVQNKRRSLLSICLKFLARDTAGQRNRHGHGIAALLLNFSGILGHLRPTS